MFKFGSIIASSPPNFALIKHNLFNHLIFITMKKIILLFSISLFAISMQAANIFVKTGATGAANGTSWTDAYTTIAAACTAAGNGDVVYVAAGTYTETSLPTITKVFTLKGGYVGTEDVSTATADPSTYQAKIRCTAASAHGITLNATTASVSGKHIFDGLYFYNTAAGGTAFGGGLFATNFLNDIDIKNCIFENNTAGKGGAIYIQQAQTAAGSNTVTIDNCRFINNGSAGTTNAAGYGGGAIWCGGNTTNARTVALSISNTQFIGNYTYPEGGAINMRDCANLTTDNVLFRGNVARNNTAATIVYGLGGAIYFYRRITANIQNTQFISNWSGNKGNLFFNVSSAGTNSISASMNNVVFVGNHANTNGQSNIYLNSWDATTITTIANSIFANNTQTTGSSPANKDLGGPATTANLNNYTLTNTILGGVKTASGNVGGVYSSFTNTDYFTQGKVKVLNGSTALDSVMLFVNTSETVTAPFYDYMNSAVTVKLKNGANSYTLASTSGYSYDIEFNVRTAGTYTISPSSGFQVTDGSNNVVTSLSAVGTYTYTLRRTPTLTGTATAASAYTTTYGTPSAAQTFPVSGSYLINDLTATAPTGFEVSSNGSTYGSTATFTQTGGSASGTLYVRLKASAAVSGVYDSKNVQLTSSNASTLYIGSMASGNVVSAADLITPSVASFTGLNANPAPSTEPGYYQSFTFSASNLVSDVTITAPSLLELSTGGVDFTSPLTIAKSGSSIAATTIYVRVKAGQSAQVYSNQNITLETTNAVAKSISCSGVIDISVGVDKKGLTSSTIRSEKGCVVLENLKGRVAIHTASGMLVRSMDITTDNFMVSLNPGVYVVKSGNVSKMLVVR